MSLENRPYVGSWRLNNKQLVQHTPDALVYINGDTSIPGCAKCNGKIDIQQFLTEVSVDAGTSSGSASATFSLSIPLHHNDSFARDAKFIMRPGLEVHVYMRGYFPVKGLYANLAEASTHNEISGSSVTPVRPKENQTVPSGSGSLAPPTPMGQGYTEQEIEAWARDAGVHPDVLMAAFVTFTESRDPAEYPYITDTLFNRQLRQNKSIFKVATGTAGTTGKQDKTRPYGSSLVPSAQALGKIIPIVESTLERRAQGESSQGAENFFHPQAQAALNRRDPLNFQPVEVIQERWEKVYNEIPTGQDRDRFRLFGPKRGGQYSVERLQAQSEAVLSRGVSTPSELGSFASDTLQGTVDAVTGLGNLFRGQAQSQEGQSLLGSLGLEGMGIEDTLAYPYYHVFHGVVTSVTHNYSNGVNNISVTCASMLHFWAYHNMSTNASVFGARATNSKNKMSLVGNNFTGMHPYAIMYSLHYDMAGAAGGVGWALSGKTNQTAATQGGDSLFSLNVRYWEQRFRRGNKLRMHGATGELFSTMSAAWLSRNSSAALSKALRDRYNTSKGLGNTKIGSEMIALGLYSGENMRNAINATRFAAQSRPDPENSTKFEINILEMQAFVSNIGDWGQINLFESTYEPKLDVANKICELTGFEFYQDVDGDFVFKPPMWNLDTSSSRVYRLEDIDLINISFSEKEPEVTYMTVKGSHFKNLHGTGMENEWGVRGQYIDYRLVAQFGWRPGNYETNYFNDPKSMFFAAVNRMDQMNIGVHYASVTIPIRPELRPGYPVYIPYLDCFYYCNSFSHSHSIGGECTTSLQLVGKRAKFYAPGTTGGKAGIEAIKLGDTKQPERPLEVLDSTGKPQLSGFPNVVMALDPTAINPLFFVVGTDIENISDTRVIKYLLSEAVELGIIREVDEPDGSGGSKKVYTMTKTTRADDAAGGSQSTEVRFFFDPEDLAPSRESGSDVNIMLAALDYKAKLTRQVKTDEVSVQGLDNIQRRINDLYNQISQINLDPRLNVDGPVADGLRRDRASKIDQAERLSKQKDVQREVLQAARVALEKTWRDPEQSRGVSVLLAVLEQTSEAYRSKSNFQNRTDLSSTANLLDMLSDKKATFSNGQQPGQYRYFSASHPDEKDQGPASVEYKDGKLVDGLPLRIEPDRTAPTVAMYQRNPKPPFAGAAFPDAEIQPGKPTAGIKVLTGNPRQPRGEVLATSEITEVMFSVQDVSIARNVSSKVNLSQVTGMGKAGDSAVRDQFVLGRTPTPEDSIQSLYVSQWNDLAARVALAFEKMDDVANSQAGNEAEGQSRPVSLRDLKIPTFPSNVQIGSGNVDTFSPVGLYRYSGSGGSLSLGPQISRTDLPTFVQIGGKALGDSFIKQVQSSLLVADKRMKEARTLDNESREAVFSAYRETFNVGAALKTTTKGVKVKPIYKKDTTFSPVFPVSDARGYHVVGSYRYGRGVDIDPEGVFDQLHKTDIFSLFDKNLVDQILNVFVQGKSIKVPSMETVDLGNGKKKIVPVADRVIGGSEAAKYLNDEALRQLRAANLTDKQILDYSQALSKGSEPNQLDFSLANFFTNNLDGIQKIPLLNAGYSLADLNFQQSGHVCACKAAEANTQIAAFGMAEFVTMDQSGSPAAEGIGPDASDPATRWVARQAELASADWELRQQALRGQVLDKSRTPVVRQFQDAFGLGDGPNLVEQAQNASARAAASLEQAQRRLDAQRNDGED